MKRSKKFIRTVRRTYISKKTGKKRVYKYTYTIYKVNGKTRTRSVKNVVYRGKLTKYGKAWVEAYSKNLDRADRNDLQARLLNAEQLHKTVTVNSIKSMLSENRTARYIYNMGGDIDELAEEMNLDPRELVNERNWDFNKSRFTYNGLTYEFYFEYDEHSIHWELVG